MRYKVLFIGVAAAGFLSFLLGAAGTAARSYNPMKWMKKPTASQQLAANSKAEKDLTMPLQALLPAHSNLKDACTAFKTLEIAWLRFMPAPRAGEHFPQCVSSPLNGGLRDKAFCAPRGAPRKGRSGFRLQE